MMNRAGIQTPTIIHFINFRNILHFNRHGIPVNNSGGVFAVNRIEIYKAAGLKHSDIPRKRNHAATAIPTHGALFAVGIIVQHFKIAACRRSKKHKSVRANAKMAVAKAVDQFIVLFRKSTAPIVDQNKVIPGALIF
jgi:hypothetical protein